MNSIGRWFQRFVFGGGAFVCFGVTLGLIFLDRVPAASLMAALFVVFVLFHYLPQMEHFKALGVEAKWRERLNEADEILRKLRQSTLASAKLTYHTLSWGSRMGGETQTAKQNIADETDDVLQTLGVSSSEIATIKQDYLFFAKYDLYNVFDKLIQKTLRTSMNRTGQEMSNVDNNVARKSELHELMTVLQEQLRGPDAYNELRDASFRSYVHNRIPKQLTENQITKLSLFADQISKIAEECEASGRVTDKAGEIIDTHSKDLAHKLYVELFDEQPLN